MAVWQYQARKSKITSHWKENRATVTSLSRMGRSAVKWLVSEIQWCTCKHVLRCDTWEWKSTVHLRARLERWSWLVSESQQRTCKHVLERWSDLRVKVCCTLGGQKQGDAGTASKSGHVTSRSSSRGRGGRRCWRDVVEAAAEVRLDNSRPFQPPYALQEVGNVTIWLLFWVVVNRVRSVWESWRVFWDTGRWGHKACYCWYYVQQSFSL